MNISRGLLPDNEKPRCKQHGDSMELVRADLPLFGQGMVRSKGRWAGRMIYRCRMKGCNWVCNGPTVAYHGEKECTFEYINPYF